MADISPGVSLAQSLDARNARTLEQVARARDTQNEASDTRASEASRTQRADDIRRTDAQDEQRRLDNEERRRDQQLAADLQAADIQQDIINDQTNSSEPLPRGSLLDVVA